MTRGLVIADDLTGAADTGVMFAKRGLHTVVLWNLDVLPNADVWVYSTESRHLSAEQAYQHTLKAARYFAAQDVNWIYKKVDSTLRGHPGDELRAVLTAFDEHGAMVAPAFPPQGRTTRDGIQYVNSVPLHETEFSTEVTTSCLKNLFSTTSPNIVLTLDTLREEHILDQWIDTHPQHVILADAENNIDLSILVHAGRKHGIRAWCGSAGLAAALSATFTDHLMASPFASHSEELDMGWFGKGVLVIAASQHPATKAQIRTMQGNHTPIINPEESWFTHNSPSISAVSQETLDALDTKGQAVLTTTHLPSLPGMHNQLVTRLAKVAEEITAQRHLSGMVLTGGDTAAAVIQALGAQGLVLRGEVESGVPWGVLTGGQAAGMPVVTKAGGFGNDQTLQNAINFLDMLIV